MRSKMGISDAMIGPLKGKLLRLALIGALALLPAVASAQPVPDDWTIFRLGPSNDVVLDGDLDTTWHVVTGGPISASPTTSKSTLFIGNNVGELDAIDLQSGQVLWHYHARNALMSAPLLYEGLVIVGEGDEMSSGPVKGVPVVVGGGPSAIDAFDQKTGERKWRTAVPGSAMPTGAIINGMLVEHNGAGWITAMDPQTGKVRYSKYLHSVASMTAVLPIGSDRFVTLGIQDNAAWLLHANDGSIVWRTTFSGAGSGFGDCPPVSDGSHLYCDYIMPASPGPYATIGSPAIEHAYGLDLATGKKIWDIRLEGGILPPRNEAAIPLLEGGTLFFGSSISPWMHAVDPQTGRVLWRFKAHGPVKGGLVDVDGIIYFGDMGGYLWALNAKSGAVVGSKLMPSGFNVGSPIVIGRTLIIGSRTGTVYALPLESIRSSHDELSASH
jgi:outer membrane protein assembly factor BamB